MRICTDDPIGYIGLPTVDISPFFILYVAIKCHATRGSQLTTSVYFDRADVKAVLHIPTKIRWELCTSEDVFPHGDASLPAALSVLPNVIEKSKRSVIIHGLLDFRLIAEGTRIVLQK